MKRPNILLLLTDQQRFDTIHGLGHAHMKTPHLDRLALRATCFTHAHSPNPVCVPARHCLLTSRTGRFHGYFNNSSSPIRDAGLPTLPRLLSDHGYRTAAIGKMHFSPVRRHHGFEELQLMEEIPLHREDDDYARYLAANGLKGTGSIHGVRPLAYHIPQRALIPQAHHEMTWVPDRAVEFIRRERSRPFFLMCGWIKPHPPWDIPEGWEDLYREADLPGPADFSRECPFDPARSRDAGDFDSPQTRRRIREAYYTSVSMVDHGVGQILDALEATRQLDDTLILFTSDHGEMLQDKGFYMKSLPYEGSVRVPLLASLPGVFAAGARDDRLTDLMDLLPTCLEAAGIPYDPMDFCGSSLISDTGPKDRNYQWIEHASGEEYPEFNLRWVSLRDRRFKYIHFYNGGVEQFFDLQKDPWELENLVQRGSLPVADFERLKRQCIACEQRWGRSDYVRDDRFTSAPLKPFPAEMNGKFPHWLTRQFPRIRSSGDGFDPAGFPAELVNSRGRREPMTAPPTPDWSDRLLQAFHRRGGDPAALAAALGREEPDECSG